MVLRFTPLFVAALPAAPERDVPSEELERRLAAYVASATAPWPRHAHLAEDFVRYVGARVERPVPPPEPHAADLFMAYGCVRRIDDVQGAFQRLYTNVVARVAARRGATPDIVAEVTQAVFERLLVAPEGEEPKLARYGGQGPLRSWVSTSAATTLAMMRRTQQRRRETSHDDEPTELSQLLDPELAYLKSRYKNEVEQAIVRALRCLDDRQRTLLRLSSAERMSIDQLGRLYNVDRSTVARWLASARGSLLEHARAELRTALSLTAGECDSLFALVRSQLDISIVRHLS